MIAMHIKHVAGRPISDDLLQIKNRKIILRICIILFETTKSYSIIINIYIVSKYTVDIIFQ